MVFILNACSSVGSEGFVVILLNGAWLFKALMDSGCWGAFSLWCWCRCCSGVLLMQVLFWGAVGGAGDVGPRLPAGARGNAVWGGGASAVLGCCLRCC